MLVSEEEKECLGGGTGISVSQIAEVVDFHRVFLLFLICVTQLWGGGGVCLLWDRLYFDGEFVS